jgi:hypothetical protein
MSPLISSVKKENSYQVARAGRTEWYTSAVFSGDKNMKASLFYRIAAVLLLFFAVGHTLGFCQSDPSWGVDTLLGSMRSMHFDVQGFSRSYWDLFVAAGLSVGVFYLFAAILAWQLGGLPAETLAHAWHCVGVRCLLCRHHGCELEIPVYPPYRFLNGDHSMFDCGSMALSAANLKPSVRVCSSCLEDSL